MDEARDAPVADFDFAVGGEDSDGDGAVDVYDLLVWVLGGDGEVKLGVDGAGGGGVEVGEPEGGDREGGAVRAVEEVEDASTDDDEEEEDEDGDGGPEAAPAAAASAVAAAGGLGAIGGAGGGSVQLRLGCWECWSCAVAVRRGFGGGENSVGHGYSQRERERKRGVQGEKSKVL